jgi:hypothetical protein
MAWSLDFAGQGGLFDMMKAILGSALGGLAAGAVALVASAQGRTAPTDPWSLQAVHGPQAMTVAAMPGASTATTNAPTLVQCEPQQEAVLRRSVVAGREVAEVTCVSRFDARTPYNDASYLARPVSYQSDIVTAPAVRTTAARPRRVVYSNSTERVERKRSWAKTAMVIGGSAGAGAGVGGLIGGKKGALIGAAIGGGAASIYEAKKR